MKKRKRRGSFRVNARGWVYLVLAVSVAFAAAFKGNNLLFTIFSVLIGLFAVSGLLTFAVARGVHASRILPGALTAGEIFTAALRLRNTKRFFPAFCLKFQDRLTYGGKPAALQPTPVWLPLAPPGRKLRGSYYIAAHERGWARLGPLTVTSEFTPGLFTYTTVLPGSDSILVYPRRGALNRRILNTLMARAEYAEFPVAGSEEGQEEFAGIRDYRDGDNPRRIHWRMSARLPGRLLTREYEDPRVRDATILLETFAPNPADTRRRGRLERAVSFAAALADALLAQNYCVTFKAFAPRLVTVRLEPQRGALDGLLHALAILRPSRMRPLGDLLAAQEPSRDEAFFVLRISDDPVPAWNLQGRAIVIPPQDMKSLMEVPS